MNVENTDRVQELQDRIHDAMIEYERQHTNTVYTMSSDRRSGNLLLVMPLLMQVIMI